MLFTIFMEKVSLVKGKKKKKKRTDNENSLNNSFYNRLIVEIARGARRNDERRTNRNDR